MIAPDQLVPLLTDWLPNQRWFGGKSRPVAAVTARPLATLEAAMPSTVWIVDVAYADGASERYQVPLEARDAPVDSLQHVLLGELDTDAGHVWVYDALHDKEATGVWLAGLHDEGVHGPLRFIRHVAADAIPVDLPSLASPAEQSNTSLMYGDAALLKVFRRLQPGTNPDIEVHGALGDQGGAHVARLFGCVEAELDGETYALAMAQEYLTSATDGWVLAAASVRDLMAEADLHADEAGGDFAAEAERLGEAVAAVHAALAEAFGTATLGGATLAERVRAMHGRLDAALAIVPQLGEVADGLRATYDALAAVTDPIPSQRIHGDLHLAQALRTITRWVIIDFEGEPMATLDERRAFDTPLRDVAGMLRSFEYAGHHSLATLGHGTQLAYRAAEWTQRNRAAFCDGYAAAAGHDPRAAGAVLRAYEADKAVYEAVYEARNRPAWLGIPLGTLARIAEGGL